jgi:hypothetical protein
MNRMNRRDDLKSANAPAALLALQPEPATAHVVSNLAELEPGELVHTGYCFRRTWGQAADNTDLQAVRDELRASMTPEQYDLWHCIGRLQDDD